MCEHACVPGAQVVLGISVHSNSQFPLSPKWDTSRVAFIDSSCQAGRSVSEGHKRTVASTGDGPGFAAEVTDDLNRNIFLKRGQS